MPQRALAALAAALCAATALLVPAPGRAAAATVVHERLVLGHSVRHRPIVAYRLGDPRARVTAVLIGDVHGDEPAGAAVARALVHGSRAVRGVDLWVVPTMNPDGLAAHTRTNAHHVDLNRNWPYRWAHLRGMYYSGPRALSEPETRAVRAFLLRVRPRYLLVLHQPLFGVDTTDGGAVDRALRHRLARELRLPEKPFRCWSVCHGSLTGWYTHVRHGIGETVEFGAHPSPAYLTGRVASGIVTALGGRLGPAST